MHLSITDTRRHITFTAPDITDPNDIPTEMQKLAEHCGGSFQDKQCVFTVSKDAFEAIKELTAPEFDKSAPSANYRGVPIQVQG